jgi:predicted secreted protein
MKKAMLALLACAALLCGTALGAETAGYPVTFLENQTTGSAWTFAVSDDTALAVADGGYQASESSGMIAGAGGTHSWTIGGLKEGEANVTFTYAQAWEPQPSDPVVVLHFSSDAAGNLTLVSSEGLPEQYMPGKVVVRLLENPTTGYQWKAETDVSGILSPDSDAYQADQTSLDAVGAGGVHAWIYSAEAAGTVAITFSYVRSFEPDKAPAGTVKLTYVVDRDLNVALMGMDGDYAQYMADMQE